MAPPIEISEIQGAAHLSPRNGDTVTTTGVLIGKIGSSFYIQDPTPDANSETSDGLQVFGAYAAAGVSVGDEVSVRGMVSDFRYTEAIPPHAPAPDTTPGHRVHACAPFDCPASSWALRCSRSRIADHPAWARWSRFLAAGDACGIVIAAAFDFKPGWPATLGGIRALKDNVVNSYCAFAERIERRGGVVADGLLPLAEGSDAWT